MSLGKITSLRLPAELGEYLHSKATDNRRSVNKEVQVIIERDRDAHTHPLEIVHTTSDALEILQYTSELLEEISSQYSVVLKMYAGENRSWNFRDAQGQVYLVVQVPPNATDGFPMWQIGRIKLPYPLRNDHGS